MTGGWSNGGNKVGVRASSNLTPKELDEKRARKECFWCTEKVTPNHQCARRKSFVIQMIEQRLMSEEAPPEEEVQEEEGDEGEEEDLQLSLHVVWGKEVLKLNLQKAADWIKKQADKESAIRSMQ